MNEAPAEVDDSLVRYLKRLVTALTVTMVAGFIVLVAVVVMRFRQDAPAPALAFPAEIALPEGATAQAVTRGADFLLVVTTEGRVLVYSPDGTTLRQEIELGH